MTVEDSAVVDVAGVSVATGAVVLTMTEHRDWADSALQLAQLAEKVHVYIQFVRSGQLYETHSQYREAPVEIELVCQYPPPERTFARLRELGAQVAQARMSFKVSVHPPGGAGNYEVSYNAS